MTDEGNLVMKSIQKSLYFKYKYGATRESLLEAVSLDERPPLPETFREHVTRQRVRMETVFDKRLHRS